MRGKKLQLSNKRFGKLTALRVATERNKSGKLQWGCVCDCGNTTYAVGHDLCRGHVQSCGCYKIERSREANTRHGLSRSDTYSTWVNMKDRCYNPNNTHYEYYGARGISVCDRWLHSFENFLEDMGERPEGKTINRIKDSKIYSKETCEWVERTIQQYDQRVSKDNTSGKVGVRWDKNGNKWIASINVNKLSIHLGRFREFEDAVQAREEAELEYYGYLKNIV